jgi:3-oxoacyl-[acyl-carrier protein] reductase
MKFQDQIVIVTGGTRGIGAALSRAFLEQGARVLATYARNDEAAQSFKAALSELGERLELFRFDVANKSEVETFYKTVEERYGEVQVLINNGGIRRDQIMASLSEDDWDAVIDTNLKGSFLMSQGAVLLMMKKRYGRIINMSSVGARLTLSGQANYSASKAGQIAIAKTLAKEVGKRGITVNCICPGFIETELIDDLSSEQIDEYKKLVPLKRLGQASEVAHAALFLASKEAGYITGSELDVAGGL